MTHSANETPRLRLVGITKRFGELTANDGVSLTVRRGEIHGLLGENGAGKTTLMNVIYGLLQPDAGTIEVDGRAVEIKSPKDARELGIGMVHQHFMLVTDMTVAENVVIALGKRRIARSRLNEIAARIRELSALYGLDLDPDDVIADASVGVRQRVEIVKLLYRGAEILILDEPTAALTPPEWEHLSAVLRSLVAGGKSVVFITHKLDELSVATRCTVLRDGRVVAEVAVADASKSELAQMMVGREVTLRVEHSRRTPGQAVLETRGLTLVDTSGRTRLSGIDLAVHEHEILGIAGVDGNGQRELVDVLTGMREPTGGVITISGRSFQKLTPQEFKGVSGGVIPDDRHHTGIALPMSVAENLLLRDFARPPFAKRGFCDTSQIRQHAQQRAVEYDIRCPSVDAPIATLSGGNQQRAILARELGSNPRVLIAAQPTRGLDVGAIEMIYRRLLEYRDSGGGILLISIELDEILSLADRIAVLVRGRLVRTIDVADGDAELLGLLMAGEEAAGPVGAAR
jgi:ABC-type uncharacterized transport system ATPase subunit